MGAFAAKLLRITKSDRQSGEDDMGMGMPPMPSPGNMDRNMMMPGGPQGFFPAGPMGPMMGMMGPGISPDMMAMGNMGNMGNIMMFGGVSAFCRRKIPR